MEGAIAAAEEALAVGEVPVGCVIVDGDGKILGTITKHVSLLRPVHSLFHHIYFINTPPLIQINHPPGTFACTTTHARTHTPSLSFSYPSPPLTHIFLSPTPKKKKARDETRRMNLKMQLATPNWKPTTRCSA